MEPNQTHLHLYISVVSVLMFNVADSLSCIIQRLLKVRRLLIDLYRTSNPGHNLFTVHKGFEIFLKSLLCGFLY